MNWCLGIILVFALSGCATTSYRMNRLSIGMDKSQVIKEIGQPDSTAAKDGIEILTYNFVRPVMGGLFYNEWEGVTPYYVRIVRGKVESFGEKGDFDSTSDPTYNINLNQRIIHEPTS